MTAIVGLLSMDGREADPGVARTMLAGLVRRRGGLPGLRVEPGAAIGVAHRPTTPEAERECLPALDPSGRYLAAWDGRIDNRDALADALGFDAATSRTATDVDYVLAAFARWGDGCVDHLLGDWTISIWDRNRRRLFCAKDPLGWRPLYFANAPGVFLFASDPRSLVESGLVPDTPNFDYLDRYLAAARPEPGATPYAAIRELDAGETLSVRNGTVRTRRHWDGPTPRERPYRRAEEYVDEFVDVFRQATRARIRSNRPVGVYLSGGLDSSYVTATAVQLGAMPTAITASAPDAGIDERAHARAVASEWGAPAVDVDISGCWALSSAHLGEDGFDDPRMPPQGPHLVALAAAARDAGCTVVLDGEGGDEWLDGDTRFLASSLLRHGPREALALARIVHPDRPASRTVLRALFDASGPSLLHGWVYGALGRSYGPPGDGVEPALAPRAGWRLEREFEITQLWRRRHASRMLLARHRDRSRAIRGWIVRHALGPSGVETRSPFHDLRIVELMASTPEWVKRAGGRRRAVLRTAGARLSASGVFDREDKTHFDTLIRRGLFERERDRVRSAVGALASYPGVRPGALAALYPAGGQDDRPWLAAWRLASAGLWLRRVAARPPTRERCERDPVPPSARGKEARLEQEAIRGA